MTRTILRALAALAIVSAVGLGPAAAQTGQMFGELVGKVTDDQGGALPGVPVTLSGPAVMGTPTAITNGTGQYRFPAVNSGTYTLKFELAGFAPLVREGIVVPVRQTITVDGSDEARVAAGNGHGERRVADRRRREHESRRASRSGNPAGRADVAHDFRIHNGAAGHDDGASGSGQA